MRFPALVVDRLLVQRLGDALRDAAVDLPLDDLRVDDRAAVVDGDVLHDLGRAGLGVDLDHADVRAGRPGEVRRVVHGGGLEVRLDARGKVVRVPGRDRQLGDRLRLVGRALHAERAAVEVEVLVGHLQLVGGDRARLLLDLLQGHVQRDAPTESDRDP